MDLRKSLGAFQKGYSQGVQSAKQETDAREARIKQIETVKIGSPFFLTIGGFFIGTILTFAIVAVLLLSSFHEEGVSTIVIMAWLIYMYNFPRLRFNRKRMILEERKRQASASASSDPYPAN